MLEKNGFAAGTQRHRVRGEWPGYTPVVTGSMRSRLRTQGILALRSACGGRTGGLAQMRGGTPTRVFLQKSLDLLDSKGVGPFGYDKEFVTV
jgi:hypothetical protein